MTDPTPTRSWLAHLRYVLAARRLAREQRWLDRHMWSSYGEGEHR